VFIVAISEMKKDIAESKSKPKEEKKDVNGFIYPSGPRRSFGNGRGRGREMEDEAGIL
jgi:hypothetical protein